MGTFWKFETVSGCGGFTGYASRFYFYRKDFEVPDEEQPWFFGVVSKIDAKVFYDFIWLVITSICVFLLRNIL